MARQRWKKCRFCDKAFKNRRKDYLCSKVCFRKYIIDATKTILVMANKYNDICNNMVNRLSERIKNAGNF